jgi:tetratricopeptide (TPR) repeat protein
VLGNDESLAQAVECHQAGDLAEAEAGYRAILKRDPLCSDALHLLGVIANQRGDDATAVDLIQRAIGLQSDAAPYYFDLGISLKSLGRLRDAVSALQQGLQLQPQSAEANNNLGCVYLDLGQYRKAVQCFMSAAALRPDYPEALNNLGNAYASLERPGEAIGAYLRALQARPDYGAAMTNLGRVLRREGRLAEAVECFRRTLDLDPGDADAHHNLGLALKARGDASGALASYGEALRLRPGSAVVLNSLGVLLAEQGRIEDALGCYETALQVQPQLREAQWNQALARLLSGDLAGGWPGYEQRMHMQRHYPHRYHKPRWEGGELRGQRLLIHDEIGYGDVFQFVRYLPLVKARGASVIFECKPGLKRLLAGMEGVDCLRERTSRPVTEADFDLYLPMESLPYVFGTTLATVPDAVPYIHPDPALVEQWRGRLGTLLGSGAGIRVGLVWSGNPDSEYDRQRSIPPDRLAPLAAVGGVRFVSLQKGPAAEPLRQASSGLDIVVLDQQLTDFADTAAVIANLDLVISAETAVPHLAGAMARPVWTLLPFVPAWRWLLEREGSPWYPSMRLFRQPRPGDWDVVIASVAQRLAQLAR